MAQLMQTDQFRQIMSNPQALQSIMQLSQAMGGGVPGIPGMPAGMGGMAPTTAGGMPPGIICPIKVITYR